MTQESDVRSDVIDLGTASTETQGIVGQGDDFAGQPLAGLSDD